MPAPKADPKAHVYDLVVLKVKDGDTIEASIRMKKTRLPDQDLGFHFYVEKRFLVTHDGIGFFVIIANEHVTPDDGKPAESIKSPIKPGYVIR